MARKREIHPGFFKNEDIADLEPLARLLFIGMWNLADREGRLEDRPKRLRAEILPYDNCDGEELVSAIAAKGFITRYEVDGNHYIQIHNWLKYQDIHPREAASVIPPIPSEDQQRTQGEPKANLGQTLDNKEEAKDSPVNPIPSFPSFPSCTSIPSCTSSKTATTGANARARDDLAEVYRVYQNNIHPVHGDIESRSISELVDAYTAKWVLAAITEAVNNGARKLSYITAILKRWHSTGLDEPWMQPKKQIKPSRAAPESRLDMIHDVIRGFQNDKRESG